MGFDYNIDLGDLLVNFRKGKNQNTEGILLQTRINGKQAALDFKNINNWLREAHKILCEIFKHLTEGELYESFK